MCHSHSSFFAFQFFVGVMVKVKLAVKNKCHDVGTIDLGFR